MSKHTPLHFVPWFHGDFLRSTAGWMPMERFTYWMLLCAQWETSPLPNDMTRLAAIAGIDMATMSTVWPVVGKKFKKAGGGLVNRRMHEHKQYVLENRARLSANGRKGMRVRWGKSRAANVIEIGARSGPHE